MQEGIKGMQGILDQLYASMLTQSDKLISVGQGIAAFAAIWYIGARVWKHIADAEPVNVRPLLRPFALGLSIGLWPYVIALMNGILQPTVDGTRAMVDNTNSSIDLLLKQKEAALKGTALYQLLGMDGKEDASLLEQYAGVAGPAGMGAGFLFSQAKSFFSLQNTIKEWMAEALEVLYEAAALCINTVRIFNLVVLAILGPLVLGLSVFDGFQSSLQSWLARYINVFMWLPVANIFGAIIATIQVNMLQLDINQIHSAGGTYFGRTDAAYLVFLVIGILGYFMVPTVAGYIVNAGSGRAIGSGIGRIVTEVTKLGAMVAGGGKV